MRTGQSLFYLVSCCSGRSQTILFKYITSESKSNTDAIPQASILGPTLFVKYINDLLQITSVQMIILYADDPDKIIKPNRRYKVIT